MASILIKPRKIPRRILPIALILILSCIPLFAQESSFQLLPDTALYEKYYGDAISHQFSISKHLESREWFGNIGGVLPLADWTISERVFQISLGATVFNTIIKTPGHVQVFTIDYLVEAFADAKLCDRMVGRFTWGHLSAHFSDDGITQLQYFPINYVRDYVALHSEYRLPNLNGKIYCGVTFSYHHEPDPDEKFMFQAGGDAGYWISGGAKIYGALDLKTKAEVNFGTTQSFQAGVLFQPRPKSSTIRVAYTHRRGSEERGQLYNQYDIKNTIGVFLDF